MVKNNEVLMAYRVNSTKQNASYVEKVYCMTFKFVCSIRVTRKTQVWKKTAKKGIYLLCKRTQHCLKWVSVLTIALKLF
jgi:hypothetical protein